MVCRDGERVSNEVGAGPYASLDQSLFLGCGRLTGPNAIEYEIYRVK
jgi:hypothetical protein